MTDLFGVAGTELLDRLSSCRPPYAARIASLRRLIDDLDFEIDVFARHGPGPVGPRPRLRGGASRFPGSDRSWGRCSSPRSVTSPGSTARRAADLLGRADAQAPRVRHPRAPRPDHQAGFPAGPLGRGRVGADPAPTPGSARIRDRVAARRGPQHRGGRRRPPAARVRLLRAARPPRPRAAPPPGWRHEPPRPNSWSVRVVQVMTPARGVVALLIDPTDRAGTAHPIMPADLRGEGMTEQPPRLLTAGTPALMRATPTTTPTTAQETQTTSFSATPQLRRTAPASRPSGRSAVGLRPSLDPDAYFGAPSNDVGDKQERPARPS